MAPPRSRATAADPDTSMSDAPEPVSNRLDSMVSIRLFYHTFGEPFYMNHVS